MRLEENCSETTNSWKMHLVAGKKKPHGSLNGSSFLSRDYNWMSKWIVNTDMHMSAAILSPHPQNYSINVAMSEICLLLLLISIVYCMRCNLVLKTVCVCGVCMSVCVWCSLNSTQLDRIHSKRKIFRNIHWLYFSYGTDRQRHVLRKKRRCRLSIRSSSCSSHHRDDDVAAVDGDGAETKMKKKKRKKIEIFLWANIVLTKRHVYFYACANNQHRRRSTTSSRCHTGKCSYEIRA